MFLRKGRTGLIRGFLVFWLPALLCTCGVYADTFNGFGYTTNSTSATITNYTGVGGDVVIPPVLGDKPVTKINTKVFYYESGLTSIVVPASVTNIGLFVFAGCDGLLSISVDTNNPTYSSGDGILFNKTKTTLIQYPAGPAGTYSVPAGVITLGYSAFMGCNVTSVLLSASVNDIGKYTFATPPLISIATDTNNPNYCSDDGVLFNKAKTILVQYPTGRAGSYTIPAGVTDIGGYAFYSNHKLTSVDIPSGVTSIGERAFFYCDRLSNLPISFSVTNIGSFAFGQCDGLVTATIPSNVLNIGANAFWNCANLERTDFLGNAPGMGTSVFTNCAAGFTVYYIAGKAGFTSPIWNGYPSAVLSGAAILPPNLPPGMEPEYEAWVLTNAPGWNAVNFTAVPAEDFEKAWLVNARPESNMQAKTGFWVKQFSVGEDQIRVTLGLNIQTQPKTGPVNGWLAVEGRNSMTDNWQVAAGQTADQNKLSFTNGHATVLFDKPASMRFFRPKLQKAVPNGGAILPLNQLN